MRSGWTGFYLGLHGAGQFGHSEDKDLDSFNFGSPKWGYSEDGFVVSGQIGTTGNGTGSGLAVVEAQVSQSGLYLIQLVNVGIGPVNIWTAATPLVQR